MKDLNKFQSALYNAGGDACLAETHEEIEWLADYVENHETTEILPGHDDFELICSWLDLTPADNPKRVFRSANYNEQALYFSLCADRD